MYEGICDGCGRQFEDDGGNITAWGDSADVEFLMQESGWQEINGKHYCPDCYEFGMKLKIRSSRLRQKQKLGLERTLKWRCRYAYK